MKLKKLLAAVTAAALAVSAMAVTGFTASAANTAFGSSDGDWATGSFVSNSSSEMNDADLVGVNKVTFNATALDLNWGWNNGKFSTNSTGGGWTDKSFGGSNSDANVSIESVGDFSVDLDIGVSDDGYFDLGWGTGCNNTAFALKSIDFYKDAVKVGTWADGVYTVAATEPDTPDTPPAPTSATLWEGSKDQGTSWAWNPVEIAASDISASGIKAGDTVKFTFTVDNGAEYHQIKIMDGSADHNVLTSLNDADAEYGTIAVSASPYSFVINEADVTNIKENGLTVTGYDITVIKVELVTAGGSAVTPIDPDPPAPPAPPSDNNETNNGGETAITPVYYGDYPVPAGLVSAAATTETMIDAVNSAADGEKAVVTLSGNTSVDKSVFEALAGKDVTAQFKLSGGVKWEINGKDVENAKKVNLGVKLRSNKIPADLISEAAGENDTLQFTLKHNGDLGFKGKLIIPFSGKYNKQYANLYYYNKSKGTLDFIGSSYISGGSASFVFTHASDYVAVIDDHPYGEDVSSAAGVYETASETSGFVPCAAIIAAAAVGAAFMITRKRLAK